MLIVADENIPFVETAFGSLGAVRTLPGRLLTPATVQEADVLLVRSVTPVNAALLAGGRVRFVGSATIGTDHVDQAWLQGQGIAFACAPGSNADSVVEYVLAALLQLAAWKDEPLRGKKVGIVGCGNIGGRLARRLPALGLQVLCNDPPLAEAAEAAGRPHTFLPLEEVLATADVVTVHTPLTREGPHATHHLFDAARLAEMKTGAWLINAARGAIVSNAALRAGLEAGRPGAAVLDVWEGEPTPDPALVRDVDLATPHIAGYSYDGKVQGTIQLYEAVVGHFGLAPAWDPGTVLAAAAEDRLVLTPPEAALPETAWLYHLVRRMYDIGADDAQMRPVADLPREEQGAYFNALRKAYPRRRAFARHTLSATLVPPPYRDAVSGGLGVGLV